MSGTEYRPPDVGEASIVVLLDDATFVGWCPLKDMGRVMDAFERRLGLTREDRDDQVAHMKVRLDVVRMLREPDASVTFPDVLASACLWLSLRHYSNGANLRAGLEEQVALTGNAVITASIGQSKGSLPGTSWSFTVGGQAFDGRHILSAKSHSEIAVYEGDWPTP